MKNSICFCLGVLLFCAIGAHADAAQQARELLAKFKAIDWDSRAVMVKNPEQANDEAWKVRVQTEFELVALDKDALPILIEATQDENRHVRALAAYVLGVLGDERSPPALTRLLQEDKDVTVRIYASDALGRLADKSALPVVQQATQDGNSFLKFSAQVATRRVQEGKGANGLREQFVRLYDKNQIASAAVGKSAPDFALTTDGTDTVRLSDFRGKKNVILIFQLADW